MYLPGGTPARGAATPSQAPPRTGLDLSQPGVNPTAGVFALSNVCSEGCSVQWITTRFNAIGVVELI